MKTATYQAEIQAQLEEIKKALDIFTEPGQVVELRPLEVKDGRFKNTYSGYFDDMGKLAIDAQIKSGRALGVYITLNPVNPDLLARAYNRIEQAKKGDSTGDSQIVWLRWFPVDTDPDRVSGISATDQELENGLKRRNQIREFLANLWGKDGVVAISGNGGHLLYRIDLENTTDNVELIQKCLLALDHLFGDKREEKNTPLPGGVKVDTSVFNPARIWKLYNTMACKGDNTPSRPHRMARIESIPETIEIVSREQLEALAEFAPKAEQENPNKERRNGASGKMQPLDLDQWIQEHGIGVRSEKSMSYGRVLVLEKCQWNADHTDGSASITQFTNGALSAQCFHNGCQGKGWQDLRAIYDGPKSKNGTAASAADYDGQDLPNIGDLLGGDIQAIYASQPQDDTGNAVCVKYAHDGKYAYTKSHGWLVFNGQHWDQDSAEAYLDDDIAEIMYARQAAIREAGDDCRAKVLPNSQNIKNIKERLTGKKLFRTEIKDFDKDPLVLNCLNGLIDLRDGQMHPHAPEQKLTHMIPVEYDQSLVHNGWKWWHDWLSATAKGGEADAVWLRKAVGYSITGLTREEVLFYIYGPSRSGKGMFIETILAMLGHPLSDELPFATFTRKDDGNSQNHDLAPLKPARFIAASESNSYERFNEAKVKALTGGNKVRCAFKFKTHFSYRPQFKIWLSSNEEINADPDDDAVWGRVRVIEFPHSHLGAEDKMMKEKFRSPENLKIILAWAVQGALDWQSEGLAEPASMAEAKRLQRAQRDTVQAFIDDIAERPDEHKDDPHAGPYSDHLTASTDVYKRYRQWCNDNGVSPKQQKGLTDALKRKGYTVDRGTVTVKTWTADGTIERKKQARCIIGLNLASF